MGSCLSNPASTTNTHTHRTTAAEHELVREVISTMPISHRDSIAKIPHHYFLTAYGYYQRAQELLKYKQYEESKNACNKALEMFYTRLNPQHFIFSRMYELYANACLACEQLELALLATLKCVIIHFRMSDTDLQSLSVLEKFKVLLYYYQIGVIYDKMGNIEEALKYMLGARRIITLFEHDREAAGMIEMIDKYIQHLREPRFTLTRIDRSPGESDDDYFRRSCYEVAAENARLGSLPFDLDEFSRIPKKETETLITPQILQEIYNYLYNDLMKMNETNTNVDKDIDSFFLAAHFKNRIPQLKQNQLLTPILIEAALTIIIDKQDEQYPDLKNQLKCNIFYTDNDKFHLIGVRTFHVQRLKINNDQ